MNHHATHLKSSLSRRTALGSLGVATALSLGTLDRAAAQDADLASHPLTGTWAVMTTGGIVPQTHGADGSFIAAFPPNYVDPVLGLTFQGPGLGRWESTGARSGRFTFLQALADGAGAYVGTFQLAADLEASEDGQSWSSTEGGAHIVARDAANTVTLDQMLSFDPPVTATRIGATIESVVLPPTRPAAATPAATTAAEGETASINGVELYYEVHGPDDGPPVLLLHGGLGNTEEFDGLLPELLAAGYRTVAMDCRGRGRSTWDETPITYELMASDALGLLDYLGIERTDFVGWSDGAIIGLELVVEHPERLERAVIYGANFTPDGFHAPTPSEQLPPFEKFIADYQRLSPQPERFEELMAELDALYLVAPNFSEAELQSITVPVLILDGAEEEMINPDQPVRMAELIPGAELVLIPDTGHFAPIAKRDEFNRIVLDFLAS